MQEFGERLAYYMALRGVSQKEVAERSGLTEAAISRYVSKAREPKAIAVANIARALNVSADDLLGIETPADDQIDTALRLVARNASNISAEQKKALINALLG